MKLISCIALLDQDSSQKVEKLKQSLSERTHSTKALEFPPHYTLWGDFIVEDKNLDALIDAIDHSMKSEASFEVQSINYGFYPWKVIFLEIEKNAPLERIHNIIKDIVIEHKIPWVPVLLLNNPDFTQDQLVAIKQFGYQFAGKYFDPHITLAGNDMKQDDFNRVMEELKYKKISMSIEFSQIALVDRENGNKLIKIFQLKQ